MAAKDVKLLGSYYSPFVLGVKIALNIKKVNYDYIEENLMIKSERLLKANPIHQKIPVLIHHEKNICESLIIFQYVDEVWSSGPSIVPTDPHDRAIARFWAAYINDKLHPAFKELRKARGEKATSDVVNKMVEGFLLLEGAFVKCSKGKPFFGGGTIGFLDIAFGSILPWFKIVEITNMKLLDEIKTPNLVAWADRFYQDPAVKDILPDVGKLSRFFFK